MNPRQRKHYFGRLWPACARAMGVDRKDDEVRKGIIRQCLVGIGAPVVKDSSSTLSQEEVTALFVFMRHIANPYDIRLASEWERCKADYQAYNVARQGDYWERQAGYRKGGKIERQRFQDKPHGDWLGESEMDRQEAEQYLMTMRARARAKMRKEAMAG